MPGAATAITFRSSTVTVGGRRIVGPLELDVASGETVVLLGASGSGKTTTLRLVNALVTPSEGEVLVRGRATSAWDPVALRRSIGYVIQEVGLLPHLSVAGNVGLVPRLLGWSVQDIDRRVGELLTVMELPPETFGARLPHTLSGGQRQRVGVARALAADPDLLLCDEPFGAVDPITRRQLQGEFRELTRRLGTTVLFVTHDVREATALADRIVILEEGRAVFVGEPADLASAEHPTVRALRALA